MKRFVIQREGPQGLEILFEGVEFSNGAVVVRSCYELGPTSHYLDLFYARACLCRDAGVTLVMLD